MVRLETSYRRFIADNEDDELPLVGRMLDGAVLTAGDLPVGSTVLYRKSGRIKRYNGRDWVAIELTDNHETILAAILQEMRQLNERISLVTA